jgi:hypothetical protein
MASPAQAGLFKKLGAVGVAVAGVETAAIASATVDAIGDTSLCRAASDQTWVRGGLRLRRESANRTNRESARVQDDLVIGGRHGVPKNGNALFHFWEHHGSILSCW